MCKNGDRAELVLILEASGQLYVSPRLPFGFRPLVSTGSSADRFSSVCLNAVKQQTSFPAARVSNAWMLSSNRRLALLEEYPVSVWKLSSSRRLSLLPEYPMSGCCQARDVLPCWKNIQCLSGSCQAADVFPCWKNI
jgi:hypothetical protein